MHINKNFLLALPCLATVMLLTPTAYAHDPVFGVGPHVLFKDGFEMHLGAHREKSDERETEAELELKYGITGDWVAGIGTGYARSEGHGDTDSGRSPSTLSSKYRFWREDTFGTQESAAMFGKVILDDGDTGHDGAAERDGNDYLLGLTYGYEGRKWYRWASVRRRFNADTAHGAERPDVWRVDLAGGIRPTPTEYHEPDWVWILELNYEHTEHLPGPGDDSRRIGGDQWFLSPGLMWTLRNFAVKTGVQLPVHDDLAGNQDADDYRALVELEWHL
ncbi:hypothetical protein EHN06_00935 [Marinobacter sp. NP-4(2019)]|uniref:hypothetical protein n=1 Tax=Marinobacter sp. NP-4(2019) TaxID=2488665 RepID=UPI000FC3DBC6|nr:hypothetical protein [Marinobacter sp. NP-4(2019)]AZT82224.1 hypothetical protein EHN06_00935 [Marinobacter sp. NP-4(2019)]